jgi:hypothetical protein
VIRIAIAMLLLAGETADLTGLVLQLGESPSERLSPRALYAPGAPPLLSFRYFDASDRGRFGNLGLMTDDAGH